jgi:hypothetical protein
MAEEQHLNNELLIHQVTGHLLVGEVGPKRIYGFFSDKKEMEEFVKTAPFKIIAIKKTTQSYRDGEGLNYA